MVDDGCRSGGGGDGGSDGGGDGAYNLPVADLKRTGAKNLRSNYRFSFV